MTTKTWNKISTVLSEMLTETLDKKNVESVMSSWNSKKSELSKIMSAGSHTKRKKDPNAPKKPNTSYIIFCGDQREKVKKANPDMPATEITTRLGELWKALSEKEKKKYIDASVKDKVRYEKEMESYNLQQQKENDTSTQKERAGPKHPMTAYMYFCQVNRPKVKEANPDMNGANITANLAASWQGLTDTQKAPYEAKQAVDKTRYVSEKASMTDKASTTDKKIKVSRDKVLEQPVLEKKTEVKTQSKEKKTDDVKKTPGYNYFLKEQTEEIEFENPDWNSRKIQTEVTRLWKELGEDDREGYETEALRMVEEEFGSEVELEDD